MIVVDCSIISSYLLPDENDNYANQILDLVQTGQENLIVPAIFASEVNNVALMAYRRNRISQEFLRKYINLVSKIPCEIDNYSASLTAISIITEIAIKHNLTSYDATYLEVALRQGARLATLDKKLQSAAISEGIFKNLDKVYM